MRRRLSMGGMVAIAVAVWVALCMGASQPVISAVRAEPVTLALGADNVALRVGGVVLKLEF